MTDETPDSPAQPPYAQLSADYIQRLAREMAVIVAAKIGGNLLPELPQGWKLAKVEVRRDKAWCYSNGGPLTYDALIEGGYSCEARGSGPTPAAAVRAAMQEFRATAGDENR
jgi:hypothetical protein